MGGEIKMKIGDIVDIIVAFLAAYLFYQFLILISGTSVPVVSVASGSMVPRLYPGDIVIATKPENLKVGDIIIYHANCSALPKTNIIHRIIGFENEKIITKGDNNLVKDPCPVEKNQVKGKVVFAAPLLGWPKLILHKLTGL